MNLGIASKEEVLKVLLDDELFDRESDDNCCKEFDLPPALYLGGYANEDIIGLFIVHPTDKGNKAHFMVLKPYRKRYARAMIEAALALMNESIYVEIPTLYKSVINFAKHAGFRFQYSLSNAYCKNGKFYDLQHMVYP